MDHRRIAAARERRAACRDLEQDPDADVGALLVGVFIFGLAYVYNYSGMAASRRLSRPSAPPSS